MAVSEEYLEYIKEMLEGVGNIHVRRMFGGTLLTVNGIQLGVVLDEELYFKVTLEALQKRFASEGAVQFTYTRKGKANPVVIKSWWKVPERYLDDREALCALATVVLTQ